MNDKGIIERAKLLMASSPTKADIDALIEELKSYKYASATTVRKFNRIVGIR